jgi:hypothetical protein
VAVSQAFLPEGSRCRAVVGAERAAEMSRIVESPTEADLADRQMTMGNAREIGTTMFEPPSAQILTETHSGLLE